MNVTRKLIATSVALTLTAAPASWSAAVVLNIDSSFEGLATSAQGALGNGTYEVGWLNPGVTRSDIVGFFNAGNLAAIDNAFNTVSMFSYTPNSLETVEPGLSLGLVFKNVQLVADGDAAGLAAYKDANNGAAGKGMFGWIRDAAELNSTTMMAFVDSPLLFPTANDTLGFTDFAETFATASDAITADDVWVGGLAAVVNGSGVDTNGSKPADGKGYYDGTSVLQSANVIPEPASALLLLGGCAALALRRRRS